MKPRQLGDFHLNEALFPPEFRVCKHAHAMPMFCVSIAGSCTELYVKKTRLYEPLAVEYLPANHEHSLVMHRQGMRAFGFEFPSELLENLPESAPMLNISMHFKGGILSTLLLRLYKEFKNSDDLSPLVIEGLALEVLGESSRALLNQENADLPRWTKQAEEIARSRFAEPLGLSCIANIIGVHPVRLAREFRRCYHMTLGEYIRRLRNEYVMRELARSAKPLAEIAIAAGFADQSHMCRTFKRQIRMTPAEYRAAAALR